VFNKTIKKFGSKIYKRKRNVVFIIDKSNPSNLVLYNLKNIYKKKKQLTPYVNGYNLYLILYIIYLLYVYFKYFIILTYFNI
jgi:hypothetical protein